MEFGLSEEQALVVDTVRAFVEQELYPLEAEVERGGGLDNLTFTLLERELGRASMALSVWWGRPSNILCACNDEQRQRYLLPSVTGEKIDALAMTEPDAGSDVRGMKCS